MRQPRALTPTLLAAMGLLLTACNPVGSPVAEPGSGPTAETTVAPTAPTSRAPTSTAPTSSAPTSSTATPTAAASSTPDVVRTAGGVLTVNPKPGPLVSAWVAHRLYELSFVVPASPDKLSFSDDPAAYSVYDWNEGDTFDPEPRVHMSVSSSATDGRAQAPVDGILGTASVSTLHLPGADDAWLEVEAAPEDPRMPGSYSSYVVTINTAARTYRVHIEVPRTDEGAEVAEEAVAGLHLVAGS